MKAVRKRRQLPAHDAATAVTANPTEKCEARRLEGKVGRSLPPLVIRAFGAHCQSGHQANKPVATAGLRSSRCTAAPKNFC
jgi:hypothetical protein